MKLTLYNAVSLDGFIARKNGDSDWVSEVDTPNFEQQIQKAGAIIVGSNTYDQYYEDIYPVDGILNLVMTRNLNARTNHENVIFFVKDPKEALTFLQQKGYSEVVLVGGGRLNDSFMQAGLIDEMILTIHPLILGDGIKLFEGVKINYELSLLNKEDLAEGLVRVTYKINK